MTSLSTLLTRIRAVVVDADGASWSETLLTEGARLALGEYALAAGSAAALAGLDGAETTTLPAGHESLVVWGAAGYAAAGRAARLAEAAPLGEQGEAALQWSAARLAEFRAMLGAAFPGRAGYASGGADPAKTAAELALLDMQGALLHAQAGLHEAQTLAVSGQEARAASAAAQSALDRAAEAERLAGLRAAEAGSAWGAWEEAERLRFGE